MSQATQPPDFLVHDPSDSVGVVVIEGVSAGDSLTGWVMSTDETPRLTTEDPVPLGHKVALCDIRKGDSVIKYSADIGQAVADIGIGGHVHVHNLKTKKW